MTTQIDPRRNSPYIYLGVMRLEHEDTAQVRLEKSQMNCSCNILWFRSLRALRANTKGVVQTAGGVVERSWQNGRKPFGTLSTFGKLIEDLLMRVALSNQ